MKMTRFDAASEGSPRTPTGRGIDHRTHVTAWILPVVYRRGASQPPRHRLRLQPKLAGEEAMGLAHRRLAALDDVANESGAVGQGGGAAIDALGALLVDQEKVVGARLAGDVDIFAGLDIALGAEDDQPAVAPDAEPVRRVPVDADIAGAAIAAQHHLAEILELGLFRIGVVGDMRRYHLGLGRAGVMEELVGLVGGDVDQDAAIAGTLVEPVRARVEAEPVRPEPDRLHDAADRPRF